MSKRADVAGIAYVPAAADVLAAAVGKRFVRTAPANVSCR